MIVKSDRVSVERSEALLERERIRREKAAGNTVEELMGATNRLTHTAAQ